MSPSSSSDPLLMELEPLYHRLAKTGESMRAWSREQLDWRPDETSWSSAQILEHVTLTAGAYLENCQAALPTAAAGGHRWRPSFAGKMFAAMLRSRRKFAAPAAFAPSSTPDESVVDAYLDRHHTLHQLMLQSGRASVLRAKMKTPVPLLSVNFGDCFRMMALHGIRHVEQLERVRTSPGFPQQAQTASA